EWLATSARSARSLASSSGVNWPSRTAAPPPFSVFCSQGSMDGLLGCAASGYKDSPLPPPHHSLLLYRFFSGPNKAVVHTLDTLRYPVHIKHVKSERGAAF